MSLDKLYADIEHALKNNRIDSELFEQCSQYLLGEVYPSLVPVRGGGDGGFDGAAGSTEGAYPLVCTIRDGVIGNVQKNLEKYLEEFPKGPQRAVVATSQFLTPRRRKNIEEAARKLGVVIVNIHDGPDFTNRLYRNPAWRKKLLGLSGKHQSLSVLPLHGRFDAQDPCIGREADFEKIARQSGDLLLIGQPGSGKTFLYQKLALEDKCLFVVSDNIDDIADEVRSKRPPIIVLDDAHTKARLLQELARMRVDIDAEFSIHANCWPGYESQCRSILNLSSSETIELGLLAQDKICEILKSTGIGGPDTVLHLLIEQAAGKPGLAVVLAKACMKGQTEQVWTGELLADHLLMNRHVASAKEEQAILATFGLGGRYGLPMQSVADALGTSVLQVQSVVTSLGAGGVIEECGNDCLAVYPSELRALLVAKTFFSGATSLPLRNLLDQVPNRCETARVLMSARQRGGEITIDTILIMIGETKSREVWEHLGYVDAECARLVLDSYPHHIHLAAPGVLNYCPAEALELLLQIQVNEDIQTNGSIDSPRNRIPVWIMGDISQHGGQIDRRNILLETTKHMATLNDEQLSNNIGWALSQLIQITYERTGQQPGNNHVFNLISGVYLGEQLKDIAKYWPEILELIKNLPLRALRPVLDQIENWCFPGRHSRSGTLPASDCDFMIATGRQMLLDIVTLPSGNRALRSWAAHTAKWAGINVQIDTDPDYEALFQEHNLNRDYEGEAEKRAQIMTNLAERLTKKGASEVTKYIRGIEQEASDLDRIRGGWDRQLFYEELASRATDPKLWLSQLVKQEFDAPFVNPFIQATIKACSSESPALLGELMVNELYQRSAVHFALDLKPFNKKLALKGVDLLAEDRLVNMYSLMRLDVPLEIRRVLLTHSDKALRGHSAIAEWLRDPEGLPEAELLEEWKSAILDVGKSEAYQLTQILKSDSVLTHAWMVNYFNTAKDYRTYEYAELLVQISVMLNRDQRLEILGLMTARSFDLNVFDALVGDDLALVDKWFELHKDEYLCMKPLQRGPSDQWIRLAERALNYGITPDMLAQECWARSDGWTGSASKHYEEIHKQYKKLLEHPNSRIHEAGKLGMDRTMCRIIETQKEEFGEAVYGLQSSRQRGRINHL